MQLTRFVDLALRVLLYVAHLHTREEPVTRRELAAYYGVSQEHLRKVIHRLAQEGLLTTSRGRHGGLRLARPAARIRLGEAVECMAGKLNIVDCTAQQCILRGPCSLKGALNNAARAFVETLDTYTLEDLLVERAMQSRMTNIKLVRAA
ncbi:MAG: Rrf2 family transcriptional regulator [Burkholderiaceae bacterium]|nr:Rrf2 family transcriptional regulator [Burkholderiaceae bacterium]